MSPTADPAVPAASRTLSGVLQALADEAPDTEIDALVTAAGRAGASPTALADVRRIGSLLEHRAVRESEAQVLYEAARDLTSLRGVDAVLAAIVDRSRRLLACDSTYIALIDDDTGDAVMRVTSGTRSAAIRTVRQPPGHGVGGRVIATGRPLATADYRTDPRIQREPRVAAAVAQDGIVSIAGVPIKWGGTVVGALLAANRRVRTFEQTEIALLTSLAGHAAIVLENARLFERVQQASDQLREANDRLRTQREALERASRAHEQLMPMALARVSLPEFARTLARILDGAVVLLGDSGAVLAAGGVPGAPRPEELIAAVGTGESTTRTDGAAAADVQRVPVRAGAETLGRLVLARASTMPAPDTDARTLERAAQTAALLLLMERSTTVIEHELRAELVADLLAEQAPAPDVLRSRAGRLGVTVLDRPQTVVALAAPGVPRRALLAAAASFAAESGGVAGEHAEHTIMLLPDTAAGPAARHAAARLRAATGGAVTAGAAGPGLGAAEIRDLHGPASRCRRLLVALGRSGEGADIAELGVLGTILEDAPPELLHGLLERALGPLLRYDQEHRTQLVATLDRFFGSGQNAQATADDLGVHVNTVYQRLERVDHVVGSTGWRDPDGALDLQMALQFHRAIRTVEPDPASDSYTSEPVDHLSRGRRRPSPARR